MLIRHSSNGCGRCCRKKDGTSYECLFPNLIPPSASWQDIRGEPSRCSSLVLYGTTMMMIITAAVQVFFVINTMGMFLGILSCVLRISIILLHSGRNLRGVPHRRDVQLTRNRVCHSWLGILQRSCRLVSSINDMQDLHDEIIRGHQDAVQNGSCDSEDY